MIYKNLVKIYLARMLPALFALLTLLPATATAQGDLLITPRRIVFEGNKQREEITLANTGQDTATYSVSFVQYHMTEEGAFEVITEPRPGQRFADPYLRFFPRMVTLAPNESQVIRMQLRRMPGMTDGEYRSHIYFRAVPDEKPLGEEETLADTTSIGIRLTPIFGITIPVIIRMGTIDSSVTLSDLKVENGDDAPPALMLQFNRSGNRSVYGDLTVEYEAPGIAKTTVGMVRGIAVYTPNTTRRFSMPLNTPEGVDFSKGKLTIRYSSGSDTQPELYAEQTLMLN